MNSNQKLQKHFFLNITEVETRKIEEEMRHLTYMKTTPLGSVFD